MAAGWIRKSFTADGVTEHPVGPHFQRLSSRFGGAVVLALDVSWSMNGDPLIRAVEGCRRFIDEAVDAGYQVGVILWDVGVQASTPPSTSPEAAYSILAGAYAERGTDVVPCLQLAHKYLTAVNVGDRVVAIFGDGDLGDRGAAEATAARLVNDNIRILTCGLGDTSAKELAIISTERTTPRTATSANLSDSIASMAQGLVRKNR